MARRFAGSRHFVRRFPSKRASSRSATRRNPERQRWDGFARLSRQGEGMIALFKNESSLGRVEVKLPTFPDGTYRVRSVVTGKSVGNFTGEQFRNGIQVQLPADNRVELLDVRH